jgi:hypothetical protein
VGTFTLNPKAGIQAYENAKKLATLIEGAPGDLKPALVKFQRDLTEIASLESDLGFPPGVPIAEVNRVRYALERSLPGYVAPSRPAYDPFLPN